MSDRYGDRGVSTSKSEVHAAISSADKGLYPGAFCKILPDVLGGDPDYCLIMHADGAGTKSALAYLAVQEGADPAVVWGGVAQDALVMNLDDCGSVGATTDFVVSNTIGRNAKRVDGSAIAGIVQGYEASVRMLAEQGIVCHLAGGETADVGDLVRTIIVDSTVTVRMRRGQVIDASRIVPGDVIVGLSSTGQANWETRPNSGMGSNGLTSARHDGLGTVYRRYVETYAPEVDPALIYAGHHLLTDLLPGCEAWGMTIGEALLSPTRTYLPYIKRLIARLGSGQIHGIIHCSGGGQSKIRVFGPDTVIYKKHSPFPVPPLFAMLKQATGSSWHEMYRVFNMGHRLEVVLPRDLAAICIEVAAACGIEAKIVGDVIERNQPGREVRIIAPDGSWLCYS